jgi:hypothetical protein
MASSRHSHIAAYNIHVKKFISQVVEMNEEIRNNTITEKKQRIRILRNLKGLLSIINSIEYRKILEMQSMIKFDLINSVSYEDDGDNFDDGDNDNGSSGDDGNETVNSSNEEDEDQKKDFNSYIKRKIKLAPSIVIDKKKGNGAVKSEIKQLTIDKWRLDNSSENEKKVIEVHKLENETTVKTNCIYRNSKTANIKRKTANIPLHYFKDVNGYYYGDQCSNYAIHGFEYCRIHKEGAENKTLTRITEPPPSMTIKSVSSIFDSDYECNDNNTDIKIEIDETILSPLSNDEAEEDDNLRTLENDGNDGNDGNDEYEECDFNGRQCLINTKTNDLYDRDTLEYIKTVKSIRYDNISDDDDDNVDDANADDDDRFNEFEAYIYGDVEDIEFQDENEDCVEIDLR